MTSYVWRRLALVVPTLIGLTLLTFLASNLAPGDPAEQYLLHRIDREPSPRELAVARHQLGLDRPVVVQYIDWVGHAVRGDLGTSYSTRRPVAAEIGRRIPITLQIALPAAVLALVAGLVGGMLSAAFRNGWPDHLMRLLFVAAVSMPSFWLGLLLVELFAVQLSLLPVAGRGGFSSAVLPVATLATPTAAVLARFTRSKMLETLGQEYILTARAKGLPRWLVIARHGLRNSLIPVVTSFGNSLGHLLSGAVIIETIFAWPGLGIMALDAIHHRDYPMIQGFVLLVGLTFIAINLAVDLSYAAIDPRVRTGVRMAAAA